MMRLFVKLMGGVLVLAVGGLFFVTDFEGRPVLSVGELRESAAAAGRSLSKAAGDGVGRIASAQADGAAGRALRLFRWQDADGVWHYTEAAPPGVSSEVVDIDPDRNVMHMEAAREAGAGRSGGDGPLRGVPTIPGLPDPATVGRLVEDAREVEVLLEQRKGAMDRASRGQQ